MLYGSQPPPAKNRCHSIACANKTPSPICCYYTLPKQKKKKPRRFVPDPTPPLPLTAWATGVEELVGFTSLHPPCVYRERRYGGARSLRKINARASEANGVCQGMETETEGRRRGYGSRRVTQFPPPPNPPFERRGGEATRLDWESAGGTWLRLASPPPLLVFLFYKFPPVSTYVSSRVCLASNGAKVKVHRWDQTCAATQQSHGQVGPDAISRTRSRVLLMFRLTILVLVFHEVK